MRADIKLPELLQANRSLFELLTLTTQITENIKKEFVLFIFCEIEQRFKEVMLFSIQFKGDNFDQFHFSARLLYLDHLDVWHKKIAEKFQELVRVKVRIAVFYYSFDF